MMESGPGRADSAWRRRRARATDREAARSPRALHQHPASAPGDERTNSNFWEGGLRALLDLRQLAAKLRLAAQNSNLPREAPTSHAGLRRLAAELRPAAPGSGAARPGPAPVPMR